MLTAVKYTYENVWDFAGGPVVKTPLPLQGAWVQSLVGELKSLLLCGVAKKKKKQNHSRHEQIYKTFLAVNINRSFGGFGVFFFKLQIHRKEPAALS